jgi:hypothetical protein
MINSRFRKIEIPPHGVVGDIFSWIKQCIVGNNQGGNMRFRVWYPIVAVVAISLLTALSSTAGASVARSASGGNNVCANGVLTKKAFLNCYNHNASARALYNSLGITAGGIKAAKTVKVCANQGYSSYGRNYTSGSKTVNPDGQRFYKRPLSSVMSGCAAAWNVLTKKGHVKVLKFCGNPETKPHKKTKKKPHHKAKKPAKKKTTPSTGCNNQTNSNSNSGNACQNASQETTQTTKVTPTCIGTVSNSCNTTIYQISISTINQYNCVVQHITYSDNTTKTVWYDASNNVTTEQACSTQVIQPPPICTHDCFPPPPVDNGPQISCTSPAHMMLVKNDMVVLYCESSDPDGDTVSVNVTSSDPNVLTVSGIDNHYGYLFDGKTPCPAGSVCTKANISAHNTGLASITATATANGKEGTATYWFPVVEGDPSNF